MLSLQIALNIAILLCSLVAGLVFTFAVVVMPGLGTLNDREFLRAFQVIDRIIQNNHPVFLVVWVGSAVAVLASAFLGIPQLEGVDRLLLIGAVAVYLLGVQLPTATINVPLNNQLQTLQLDAMDASSLAAAREAFEARWNQWNVIRTVLATVTSILLLLLISRL